MTFQVEITREAELDSSAILDWLMEKQAGRAGATWYEGLERAIESLSAFPRRCSLAPESKMFSYEVRNLFYGRHPHVYRIVFVIESNTVYILRIRHGRREH